MKEDKYKILRDKDKYYRLTTTRLINLDLIDKRLVLNLNVRMIVKFSNRKQGYIYELISFDEEFINKNIEIIAKKNLKYKEIIETNKDQILTLIKFSMETKIKVSLDGSDEIRKNGNKIYVYCNNYYSAYLNKKEYSNYCIEEIKDTEIINNTAYKLGCRTKIKNSEPKIYEHISIMFAEISRITVLSPIEEYSWGLGELEKCIAHNYSLNFKRTEKYEEFINEGNKLDIINVIKIKNGIKLNNIKYKGNSKVQIYEADIDGTEGTYIIYKISEIFHGLSLNITNTLGNTEIDLDESKEKYYLCGDNKIEIQNNKVKITGSNIYGELGHGITLSLKEKENFIYKYYRLEFIKNKELRFNYKEKVYLLRGQHTIELVEESSNLYNMITNEVKSKEKMKQYKNIDGDIYIYIDEYKYVNPNKTSKKLKLNEFIDQVNYNPENISIIIESMAIKGLEELENLIEKSIQNSLKLKGYRLRESKELKKVMRNMYELNEEENKYNKEDLETIKSILDSEGLSIEEVVRKTLSDMKNDVIKYDKYIYLNIERNNLEQTTNFIKLFTLDKEDEIEYGYKEYIKNKIEDIKIERLISKI